MGRDARALEAKFRPLIEAELAELERQPAKADADRRPVDLDQQSVGGLPRMDTMQMEATAQSRGAAPACPLGRYRTSFQADG
jgi:DnaK suppressor protein